MTQATGRGEEPPMFLQRPSTGKSQDVRHILTKTFRELFTRDAIGPDTVKNLSISKGGDDPYHERYVESLQKVFDERQRRLDEAAMLERHIMQAQARAMSADEREINRVSKSCDNYSDLGLPPGRSHFRSCIDSDLLKKHKLLTPEDYATDEPSIVPPPQGPKIPSYARETVTSRQHTRQSDNRVQSPMNLRSRSQVEMPDFLDDDNMDIVQDDMDSSEYIPEEVNRTYQEAMRALRCLSKQDFDEVKRLHNPPQGVKDVLEILCLLLNQPQDWASCRQILNRIGLVEDLLNFDKDNITDEAFERLETFANNPAFSYDIMKNYSLASAGIYAWIYAVYQYAKIHRTLNPRLRKLLARQDTDMQEAFQRRPHDWKMHMTETLREMDRKDLANLHAMVDYQRNPRYVPPSAPPGGRTLIKSHKPKPKEFGIQDKEEPPKPKEPSVIFLLSPRVVKFTDYKVGQVYEITLELKNISAVMRQCRALPPKTSYFQLGLGQFPGEHGLVAPGMSVHYAIRFAPDSVGDYDDEIKIQTQSSTAIVVPLQGRREPPQLTLPSVIDVGHCLVGGYHVVQFIVKNKGGSGRFCFLPRTSWPATNFKSVVTNGSMSAAPFEVRPSVLELLKGDSGVIEVVFSPTTVRCYTQEITMVCDNCQVKHFTLTGESQLAKVDLLSVERGLTEVLPGELSDVTAQHLIRFDDLNPFTYTDRTVKVRNMTNVQMPFSWMIYKPIMSTTEDLEIKRPDRVPDVDSVFSVHPPSGVLPADEEVEFKVTFAPPVVSEFHSALHLQLQQIPPYKEVSSAKSQNGERNKSIDELDEDSLDDDDNTVYLNNDVKQFRDVTAMEIQVKGKSTPLNVVLHPYAVHVPGQTLVGSTVKRMVTMANHSRSTITFQWQPFTEKHIIEVEPPFGELDPGMAMDTELSITGAEPGKIEHTLYCYVMNLEEPLHLHVQAEFKGPELSVEEPDLNFGLVRLGQTVEREITLCNRSQIITKWKIQDSADNRDSANKTSENLSNQDNGDDVSISSLESLAESEFKFMPAEGELSPLERRKVKVKFRPRDIKSIRHIFEIAVEDGQECNINVFAEVQIPMVCLSSCEVCMEEVYKGVPVVYQAELTNQILLPTSFEWGEVEGIHAEDCSIELEPKSGVLSGREQKSITINFVAHRQGEFSEVRIPCKIDGMENPLYLGIFCDVKGLSVNFKTSKEGPLSSEFSEEAHLAFGEVKLAETPKLFLHVRNESAITARYSLNMEYFFAKPPTPPSGDRNREVTMTKSQRRLLGRTPNLADPLSKTPMKAHNDLCQAMLSVGRGAAFVCHPASGTLQPFGEEIIDVTAYSDMWGNYTDNLICTVGDLDPSFIPVSMNVTGCPLNFQIVSSKPDQQPIVRFGTHVSGVPKTKRTMRINNPSPFDLRLDWEVFNIEDDDDKLLDVIVSFGESFPLRDEKGNEVIPPREEPAPLKRVPTDFIPNSSDTSPSVSREATYTVESNEDNASQSEEEVPTEQQEKPKLISLCYRAHEGVRMHKPYDVRPRQVIVPAHGHTNVGVQFTPHPSEEVTCDLDCIGYGLGYMSLDKNLTVKDKVTRIQGYDMTPLRIDMTAHIKPALLNIECEDEDGMIYRSAMSDLLVEDGQTKDESFKVCGVKLSNQTQTPLTFRLITQKPFLLVNLDPSTNEDGLTTTDKTEMQTLRPQHNLMVKVAFQTTLSLLGLLENPDSKTTQDDEVLHSGRKLNIKDNLIVHFNNETTQSVPLFAALSIPQMELSRESLDYGTCLVGQKREFQLLISNRTASHCQWSVTWEPTTNTCASDTFTLTPSAGHLEAHITHISKSQALLKVFFVAKHAEHYEGVFVFQGLLGEEPRKLFVRGEGSYDQKHEAILNV